MCCCNPFADCFGLLLVTMVLPCLELILSWKVKLFLLYIDSYLRFNAQQMLSLISLSHQLTQGLWFNKQGMKQLSFGIDMGMKCQWMS